ncbi:MAG: histidine kinase dimerization/phospho-acceptor domain-containing protein, partial [Planctomycetota bacterium]
MLLSGAGLLAFAMVNLWETVRDADERARTAAERQARDTAKELRELLQQEWILAAVPQACRFEVRDGTVVVPKGLAPTGQGQPTGQPTSWSEADLPLPALTLLQAARQEEFKKHDKQSAGQMLTRALAHGSLSDQERGYLTSVAAWQAYRAGDRQRAHELLEKLEEVDELLPAAAASSLLLLVELDADKTMPTTLATLAASCAALGEAEVHAIAQRLRSKKLDAVARRLRESVQARRTLVQARLFLDRLLAGETLFAVGADKKLSGRGGDVCLFRADETRPRSGVGIIVPGRDLLDFFVHLWAITSPSARHAQSNSTWQVARAPARLRELVTAYLNHMTWGDYALAEAALVIPGFLAVRPHAAGRSFWTQPATLIVLLIVISVSFGLGLFLSFRAMLRESAAMKARADFLTSVTHELKTPLASIRLLAEMLDEGRVKGTEKQQEYYRLLAGESARLTVLIENVLDLGRMERGERAYDLRRSHIDGVVKEA